MSDTDDDSSDNIIAGPVLIVIAILALWYNEGRFDHSWAAGRSVAVTSLEDVDPARTVSYTGILGECLIRERYLLPFAGYYQVSGTAEIYSWKRHTDDDGDVSWSKDWHSFRQDNARNEGFAQQLRSVAVTAETLRLDDMEIRPATLHFVNAPVLIPPESAALGARGEALLLSPEGEYFYIRKPLGLENQLGDERIRYEGIPVSQTATYFGVIQDSTGVGKRFDIQSGFASSFINGLIENDGVLHHLVNGTRGEALRAMRSHHRKLKWTVRLAGTAGLVVGFFLILSEFVQLLLVIPLLGGLARGAALIVSLILGLTISFLTIFAALAFHHPVAVLVSLTLVSLTVILLVREGRKMKADARRKLMRTCNPDLILPSE